MSSSATGVGMTICFLGAILLILTQKSSQKFGDVLGIFYFSGTPTPSSFCIHTLLYRVIAILLQNYNPVATKTDIGRRKMKRED